jgi:hypothetical protein
MTTRKNTQKDKTGKETSSRKTRSTSNTPAAKRASTADPEAQVTPSRKGITGKKNKGTDSKEYRQPGPNASRSNWDDPMEQIHTHNPGRIHNEQNTRGLGYRKKEQSARNISGEQFYDNGSGAYGEQRMYRTNQNTSQYPPHDRGYDQGNEGFRDEFNYNDSYWWEGQFPQGASSWEGDGRWQHHDRPWSARRNQQGNRYNMPYGGDYEKYNWLNNRNRHRDSDDYNEGFSRGHMTRGEAMYPADDRLREDIYQDPGRNFDADRSGYRQAYYGPTDIGRVPDERQWREDDMAGGSHFHRDDHDWDNWDAKRRDLNEFDARGGRWDDENDDDRRPGRWTARDEYRQRGNGERGHRRQDNEYHSRSTDMRERIMDYMDEGDGRHMRTVYTNTLDTPYEGGYNRRTPQTDRRIGTGGYNQGGYGSQGYSYEYGNAGGYGSTGAYQTGHRGEHRRGGYQEGFRYAERQDELKGRSEPRDYDKSYIVGSDEEMDKDVNMNYRTRLMDDMGVDTAQPSGQVHGIQRYGEGEGNKWKNLGKSHRR